MVELFFFKGVSQTCKDELENYLFRVKLTPRWKLNGESAVESLAESGIADFCRMSYEKWKENKEGALGIKLLKEFVKTDMGLAMKLRQDLLAKGGLEGQIEAILSPSAILGIAIKNGETDFDRYVQNREQVIALGVNGFSERAIHYWKTRFGSDLELAYDLFLVLAPTNKDRISWERFFWKRGSLCSTRFCPCSMKSTQNGPIFCAWL